MVKEKVSVTILTSTRLHKEMTDLLVILFPGASYEIFMWQDLQVEFKTEFDLEKIRLLHEYLGASWTEREVVRITLDSSLFRNIEASRSHIFETEDCQSTEFRSVIKSGFPIDTHVSVRPLDRANIDTWFLWEW